MPIPVRKTNRRKRIFTRKLTVKVDKEVLEIANPLVKSIAGFIDAQAADQRSRTSIEQIASTLAKSISGFIDAHAADQRSKTSIEQTKFSNDIAMRARIFALIAPKIRTVGGMAPIGPQFVKVSGEGPNE